MSNLPTQPSQSPFEAIKQVDEHGDEYWSARALMKLLKYTRWDDFLVPIEHAKEDCENSGRIVEEHFHVLRNIPQNPSGGRPGADYRLTAYACRLIAMAARPRDPEVTSQARTYFSDKVEQAEQEVTEAEYLEWRRRFILSAIAHGHSQEWAENRLDKISARKAVVGEWVVRDITEDEIPILTDRLHMGAFGLSIADHKALKGFPVTYKGKRAIYKGDLPPAMTATELAISTLADNVARALHIEHDSHGFGAIAHDVDVAGDIASQTRKQLENATKKPVVSPRNMLHERDGGLWGQLPAPD
jgi:hypothetical protein